MSMAITSAAIGAVGVGVSLYNGYQQSQAIKDASGAQVDAAQSGIDEQRRQFDAVQKLLSPYTQAGESALKAQQDNCADLRIKIQEALAVDAVALAVVSLGDRGGDRERGVRRIGRAAVSDDLA